MANQETVIQAKIRAAVNKDGRVRLWRNMVGGFETSDGGYVKCGLALGSGDLIGMVVGTARFVSFEIKTPKGRLSKDQKIWAQVVRRFGGFACCVRSVEEALAAVDRACSGMSE